MQFGRRVTLTRQEAVLAAAFPFVALSVLNEFYKPWLWAHGPAAYWLGDCTQYVLAPLMGWYFFLRPAGVAPRDFGFGIATKGVARRPGLGLTLFMAALLIAAYWPAHEIAVLLLHKYNGKFDDGSVLPTGKFANLLLAIWMSATAALIEEAVWRGLGWQYLSTVLPTKGRRLMYVLITSVAFAIAHSEQGLPGVVGAFWFGILAAGFYTKLGSLWPVAWGHFAIDMLHFGPWR